MKTPLISVLALFLATAAHAQGDPADAGRHLYRDGLLPDGQSLRATVAGDAPLVGIAAACVSCHRRSGLGSVEGGRVIAPIAASALFAPRQPARPGAAVSKTPVPGGRPAYTEASLRRAIREGVDPAGRTLDALMPRYALDDAALDPLIAYLKTLSVAPVPGVTAERIHFATIVTDGVTPSARQALLGVLERYFADHNAGIRQETRRGQRAVLGHSRGYRAWRTWQLHVWELAGAPDTWAAQLERHYRDQTVFAVVSGIGRGAWQPVHTFCEQRELPCLFPNSDLPPEEYGFYSLYFSRGLTLEADLLAHDLSRRSGARRVLQVYRDEEGAAAAATLRRALAETPAMTLTEHRLASPSEKPLPGGVGDITDLVLWLPAEDLAAVAGAGVPPTVDALYMSSTLLGESARAVPPALQSRARLVHPYDLPASWETRRARLTQWLRARGLPPLDERVQANAYFAIGLVGHALEHLRENISREYLIERLEHATENAPWSSVYRALGLGSRQRFASKGGYIVRWRANGEPAGSGDWIVPFTATWEAHGG